MMPMALLAENLIRGVNMKVYILLEYIFDKCRVVGVYKKKFNANKACVRHDSADVHNPASYHVICKKIKDVVEIAA